MAVKKSVKSAAAQALAGFPMYDFPWLRAAYRDFWAALAGRLKDAGLTGVPARLNWSLDEETQWSHPNLLLTQTCGYPLMKGLAGGVRIVATPSYDVPFCDGTNYCSLVIVREDDDVSSLADLRGRRAAINKVTSHSGYNAFRRLIADYQFQRWSAQGDVPDFAGGEVFFSDVITTGRHADSLAAVRGGKADVAAIDAVTYHHIATGKPAAVKNIRVLTTTLPAPALPLITAGWRPDDEFTALRTALSETLSDAKVKPALEVLRIGGFHFPTRAHYRPILEMERQAEDVGYPSLV